MPVIEIHVIRPPWQEDEEALMREYVKQRHILNKSLYSITSYQDTITETDRSPNVIHIIATVDGKFAGGEYIMTKKPKSDLQLPIEKKFSIAIIFPRLNTDELTFAEGGGFIRIPEFSRLGVVERLKIELYQVAADEGVDIYIGASTDKNKTGIENALDKASLPYAVRDIKITGTGGNPRTLYTVAINPLLSEEVKNSNAPGNGRGSSEKGRY